MLVLYPYWIKDTQCWFDLEHAFNNPHPLVFLWISLTCFQFIPPCFIFLFIHCLHSVYSQLLSPWFPLCPVSWLFFIKTHRSLCAYWCPVAILVPHQKRHSSSLVVSWMFLLCFSLFSKTLKQITVFFFIIIILFSSTRTSHFPKSVL